MRRCANDGEVARPIGFEGGCASAVVLMEHVVAFARRRAGALISELLGLLKTGQKCMCAVQSRQRINDSSIGIEDVMDTVAGDGAFDFAPVPEVDGHFGDWSDRFPMENEVIPKITGHLVVRVEGGAEESAIGATEFVIEIAEQAQRKDRLAA